MKLSLATQDEIAAATAALGQATATPKAASFWLMQAMHHCHQAATTHHAHQKRAQRKPRKVTAL